MQAKILPKYGKKLENRIKAVIFDYGGVIKPFRDCRNEIAQAYGIPPNTLERAMHPFMEDFRKGCMGEDIFWDNLSKKLGKSVPQNKDSLWRTHYEKTFSVYPEIIGLIKTIRKKGLKTAVLSNAISPHLQIMRKKDDFTQYDAGIFSCEVGCAKPDPAIYLLATHALGVKPQECVFVDDSEKHLVPAEKLGMKTILAKHPSQVAQDVLAIVKKQN